jgi:hypothetical protein
LGLFVALFVASLVTSFVGNGVVVWSSVICQLDVSHDRFNDQHGQFLTGLVWDSILNTNVMPGSETDRV